MNFLPQKNVGIAWKQKNLSYSVLQINIVFQISYMLRYMWQFNWPLTFRDVRNKFGGV